jgi:hypothetical protein
MSGFQTPPRERSDSNVSSIGSIGSFSPSSERSFNDDENWSPVRSMFETPRRSPRRASEFPDRSPMFDPDEEVPDEEETGDFVRNLFQEGDGFDAEMGVDEDMHARAALAFQIHNKFKAYDFNKIMAFLKKNDPTDYTSGNAADIIKDKLKEFIKEPDEAKKQALTTKLNDILDKLRRATGTSENQETKQCAGRVVTIVSKLSTEFKDQYIRTFIKDCTTAYGKTEDEAGYEYDANNISCPPGIIERLILILFYTANYFSDQEPDKDTPLYNEIIEAFKKPVPKIEIDKYFAEWYKTMPDTDRLDSFISYVKRQQEDLDDETITKTLEESSLYEDFYKDVLSGEQLGGRRKRTLKKRKAANKTKKRGKPIIRKRVNKTKRRRNTKKRK